IGLRFGACHGEGASRGFVYHGNSTTLSRCLDRARNHCAANTRDGGGNHFSRGLSADTRRSLHLCRPAAISGAFEAISRLTLATRRSLSFACAVVSGPRCVAEVTKQ